MLIKVMWGNAPKRLRTTVKSFYRKQQRLHSWKPLTVTGEMLEERLTPLSRVMKVIMRPMHDVVSLL